MRRTFWPNCICQRFRSKNRSTGLKFTPIRENSRLSMKIVQNVLFRQWRGRFGQIAFFNSTPTGLNFTPIRENSRISMKIVENVFSGHVEDVSVKTHFQRFGANNRSTGRKFTPIRENSRLSMKIVQNVLFRPREGRFGQNAWSKSRPTGLNFTPIRENCRLSMKIVQNVLLRQCGGGFSQIAFFKVSVPKIALPDWNSRQYVKTRISM